MLKLTGRTITKIVEPRIGYSLLKHAQDASIDWQYNCSRGTCAKCRCIIREGAELLSEVNDAEWDRLGPEELDAGFRLGCQTVIEQSGNIWAENKTYF